MTKYVEFDQPWQYGDGQFDYINVSHRVTVADAVKWQRVKVVGSGYTLEYSDEQCLEDFLMIYFAKIVEE